MRRRVERDADADLAGGPLGDLVAGVGVGAWIHGYVPQDFMARLMGKSAWWSVPAGVLLGVPLYSNAAGIIPVVHALMEKGAALGTVLAFMMSVIGLSLPDTIILRKCGLPVVLPHPLALRKPGDVESLPQEPLRWR